MKPLYDDPVWIKKRRLKEEQAEVDALDTSFDDISVDTPAGAGDDSVITRFRMLLIDEFSGSELKWPQNIIDEINSKPDGSFNVTKRSPTKGRTRANCKYVHFAMPDDALQATTFLEAKFGDRTYYYSFLDRHMPNELKQLVSFIIENDEYEFMGES